MMSNIVTKGAYQQDAVWYLEETKITLDGEEVFELIAVNCVHDRRIVGVVRQVPETLCPNFTAPQSEWDAWMREIPG